MVGSAALMRRCYNEALHSVSQRKAFGSTLIATPLMLAVMADMALEVEAAMALSLHVARTFDNDGNKVRGSFRYVQASLHLGCRRLVG